MNNTHTKIEDWPEIIYSVSKYKELEGHTEIKSFDAPVKSFPHVEYIRADIAKEREAKLLEALKDARVSIEDYSSHAGDYIQKKYRLKEELANYDAIISEFEERK